MNAPEDVLAASSINPEDVLAASSINTEDVLAASSISTVQRVREALDAHGVAGAIHTFATPVPSAAAAADQLGCPVGAIVNSLVFSAAGEPVLVLTSGAHRVDVARVARHLGVGRKQVRRADPEFVLAATGQRVGGVAPVGHPGRLTTLVDTWLERYDVVWAGAGDEHSVFPVTCAELVRMTGGTLVEVGDEP
jgi:prolyl-tRNA editing enzyme YbaK/EbsC (Cys-tRNA(Pro) deacylase)